MLRNRTFAFFLWIAFLGQELTNASTLADRKNCKSTDKPPNTRVDTTDRLAKFREAMKNVKVNGTKLSAFIVGSADAHNSEYPPEYDKRRGYMTGFSGSAGTAVITETKAALWTDSRYFLEAEATLDCNWILMKDRLIETPSINSWLNDEIQDEGALVGVDQTLITNYVFLNREKNLKSLSHKLKLTPIDNLENPVDKIWKDRPLRPTSAINPLPLEFAGLSWNQKIINLRANMSKKGATAFVVTALDETAWLFNIRGTDVVFNPVILAFTIVEMNKISLYILDKDRRLRSKPKDPMSKDQTLADYLNTAKTGKCAGKIGDCVNVLDYDLPAIEKYLTNLAKKGKVWVTHLTNHGIYKAVDKNRLLANSPIAIDKSIKNSVERVKMTNCTLRDSLVLSEFLAFLEKEIKNGKTWTEVSAATELTNRRKLADFNRGISFATISSYGSNGAVIHYRPSNLTDKKISTDNFYLLDSGGQYLDGTTDVTRTMHYGTPTDYEKECYTRVLASTINLALLKWPNGLYGRQIDAITRYQLWDVGMNYRHGTGHGVGSYLYIHEGPGSIGLSAHQAVYIEPLMAYQFFSDEPGYYEDGKFGIRLETVLMIEPYTPKYSTFGGEFLHFTPVQLVPFEPKLINFSFLTARQVQWLNDYNAQIRQQVLTKLGSDALAYDWVKSRTEPITVNSGSTFRTVASPSSILTLSLFLAFLRITKTLA